MQVNSITSTSNSFGNLKTIRYEKINGVIVRIVEDPMITQMKRFKRLKKTPKGKGLCAYDLYPIAHKDYEKVRNSKGKIIIDGAAELKAKIIERFKKIQAAQINKKVRDAMANGTYSHLPIE